MRLVSDPALTVEIVAKIPPPDKADIIQFEALDVIHATDLVNPVGISGPQASRRDPRGQAPIPGLGIPGSAIVANNNVVDQSPIRTGLRPPPTEPGGHTRGKALVNATADRRFKFLRRRYRSLSTRMRQPGLEFSE